MKVKVFCKDDKKDEIENMLRSGGFEISEQGDYEFIEKNFSIQTLMGTDEEKNQCIVDLEDVLYIDSIGRNIVIHTGQTLLRISETLEKLEKNLPVKDFVRISKSTIIRRNAISKISPSFQMRFKLTMKNNDVVYVTRSYYYNFMSFMNL